MPARSTSLFHFTDSVKTIFSILENGFLPMYCTEPIDDLFGSEMKKQEHDEFTYIETNTFPMVSFCDIPLTRVDEHIQHYGAFAIGMSQTWGLNRGLTPVWYYDVRMPLYGATEEFIKQLQKHRRDLEAQNSQYSSPQHENASLFLRRLRCYFKPMRIKINEQQEAKSSQKRYQEAHQENEWRYIPDIKDYELETKDKFLHSF